MKTRAIKGSKKRISPYQLLHRILQLMASAIARYVAPRRCFSSLAAHSARCLSSSIALVPLPVLYGGQGQSSRGFAMITQKKLWFQDIKANRDASTWVRPLISAAELELEKKNRPPVQPGEVSPKLAVPDHIPRPPYVNLAETPEPSRELQIQDAEGITRMRAAGSLVAEALNFAGSFVKPGVTTDEIDRAVHKMIVDAGAYPSLLDYGGFPKSISTGINEIMCFGTPDSRPLQDGDIISIHISVYLNGYHADADRTFLCGTVDDSIVRMCQATLEALEKAIEICGPGVEFRKIGDIINDVADRNELGVVRYYHGHGIGKILKSEPSVRHYRNDQPGRMVVGQTFTIEPIFSLGSIIGLLWQSDKRTIYTLNNMPCARFEHTLLVTPKGVEVLTF